VVLDDDQYHICRKRTGKALSTENTGY